MLAVEDYERSIPVISNLDVRSSNQIDVYWNQPPPGENVASYNLRINGGTIVAGITYLSYLVTNLNPNSTYSFEVQAVDQAGGKSAWSQAASATTML